MAFPPIQLKRSDVSGRVPAAGDLALGELAMNTADGRLFARLSDGTVIDLSLYRWWAGSDKQFSIAAATGTVTLNLSEASVFDLTLTGNTVLAVSNLPSTASGATRSYVVRVRQGATPYTLTWWSGITWLTSATPDAPAANKTVEYVLSYSAAGWTGRVGAGN